MQQMQRGFLKKALRPIAHQVVLVQQMQQMQRGFLKKHFLHYLISVLEKALGSGCAETSATLPF